ncbi:hypothetical protein D3C76_1393580 [compost metagenome]
MTVGRNSVYRVHSVEVLEDTPACDDGEQAVLAKCHTIGDALSSLGLSVSGAWAFFTRPVDDESFRMFAWQV